MMVCFATEINVTINKPKHVTYRSFKHFGEDSLLVDLSAVPFEIRVCETFDNV